MKVDVTKTALKDLKKIDKLQAKKIYQKMQELEDYPDIANIKKLVNLKPAFRLR